MVGGVGFGLIGRSGGFWSSSSGGLGFRMEEGERRHLSSSSPPFSPYLGTPFVPPPPNPIKSSSDRRRRSLAPPPSVGRRIQSPSEEVVWKKDCDSISALLPPPANRPTPPSLSPFDLLYTHSLPIVTWPPKSQGEGGRKSECLYLLYSVIHVSMPRLNRRIHLSVICGDGLFFCLFSVRIAIVPQLVQHSRYFFFGGR